MPSKLPSGRWRARYFDEAGNRRSRSFRTKADAKACEDKAQFEVRDGTYSDDRQARRTTLGEWAERYFRVSDLRDSTLAQNEHYYRNHIDPRWGKVPLGAIKQLDVLDWIADLKGDDARVGGGRLAPATTEKVYAIFRKIYLSSVDAGVLPLSKLPRRPNIAGAKEKRVRFLTVPEVQELAEAMDSRYTALVWLGCFGGPRLGELAALRLDDLDTDRCRVRIDEQEIDLSGHIRYDKLKTDKSNRVIPVPRSIMAKLVTHIETFNPSDLIFPGPAGGPMRANNWRKRFFNPAAERAGLVMTPHDMRHTAASLAIAAGTDMLRLAANLGHTDTRMIERVYGHLYEAHRDAAAEALEEHYLAGLIPSNVVALRPLTG